MQIDRGDIPRKHILCTYYTRAYTLRVFLGDKSGRKKKKKRKKNNQNKPPVHATVNLWVVYHAVRTTGDNIGKTNIRRGNAVKWSASSEELSRVCLYIRVCA